MIKKKRMQDCGASAITVHTRTKNVKDNLKIPVIANGDIKTVEDCQRVYEIT